MENTVSEVASAFVPEIVITEPSPMVQNGASVTVKAAPTKKETEDNAKAENQVSVVIEQTETAVKQIDAVPESETNSSGEFISATECNECVVPVSQPSSVEEVAAPEPDQDNFRVGSAAGCCLDCTVRCLYYYELIWNIMHSRYAIPVWLLLLCLPISAGVMGALHMYSCPAAHSMAILIFIIGISFMAVISLRVCLIIHRMTAEDEDWRNMLHTLLLVATFLTLVFFVTESVAFWRMDSTSHPGTMKYCDPQFLTFSFWWNCIMSVLIVPMFFFPA